MSQAVALGEALLSRQFLSAHTEAQVASLLRTHHAQPERTAAFVAAVLGGSIRPCLALESNGERRALRMLGVSEHLIGTRPAAPRPLFTHLKPPFFRGSFAGQVDVIYRARHQRLSKVLEFQRAILDGAIRPPPWSQLSRRCRMLLTQIGAAPRQVPPETAPGLDC